MEINKEQSPEDMDQWMKDAEKRSSRGKIAAGILIIGVGIILLAQTAGFLFPSWLISWKTGLIAIGLVVGARHGFRNGGWFIPIIIGLVFLIGDFNPDLHLKRYFWPIFIIAGGLYVIFKPRRTNRFKRERWKRHAEFGKKTEPLADGNYEKLEVISVFGGSKKNVLSKNFQGGEVICVFGGADMNFNQADFTGTIELESIQIFGGAKFVIPAHWSVHSEVACIFGSVEDNRPIGAVTPDTSKVLILRGVCLFGGIELVSY